MKNFKASVPLLVQNKIREFANAIDFSEIVVSSARHCAYSEQSHANEIEGNPVSGWIPLQDGGFEFDQFYRNDIDSTCHFTANQTEFNAKSIVNCFAAFLSDNHLDSATIWSDLDEVQREDYAEYENSWFDEPSLLSMQIYCRDFEINAGFVTIKLLVNYQDAPYYRDGRGETIKEITLSVDKFMNTDNDALLKQFEIL